MKKEYTLISSYKMEGFTGFLCKIKMFCSPFFPIFILKLSKGLGEDVMALIYISLSICCISIHYILLKSVSFFLFPLLLFFIESLLRYQRSQWIFMDTLTIWNIKCVQSYSLGCKNGANVSILLRISWSRRSTGSRVFQELDWFSVATGCTCTAGKVVMSLFLHKIPNLCTLTYSIRGEEEQAPGK